ncbi:MAG: alpha/beta hydrolase [bacterium]
MRFVLYISVFLISVFISVKFLERYSTYYPSRDINAAPDMLGLPFEDVEFATIDKNNIQGWFIPHRQAEYTILFFHGNAGNISHRLEKIYVFYSLHLNQFIFDYRGYGESQGFPTEKGLSLDAQAAYAYLTEKRGIPDDKIILYGESLGGAVAIDLAVTHKIRALITEETFSSVKDMAGIYYPLIPGMLVSNSYDSLAKVQKITHPKLIIHSTDDDIVPYALGEKLFKEAQDPKKLLTIKGSHNSAFFDSLDEVKTEIASFIANLN